MSRRPALAALAVLSLATLAAGETVTITALEASASGSTVAVSGTVAVTGDGAVQVGSDSGDTPTSQVPGADLTTATISSPNLRDLVFTVGLANQPPAGVNGVPEVIHYIWHISVITGNNSSAFELMAVRSAQFQQTGSTEPWFGLLTCMPGTGAAQCSVSSTLVGRMQDGVVEWTVPRAAISASGGSTISVAQNGLRSTVGAAGAAWFTNLGGDTMASVEDYTVPGTVAVGIAPATTPDDQVPLTVTTAIKTSGSFSTSLPKPATAGDYKVAALACFGIDEDGQNVCELGTTPVTVT